MPGMFPRACGILTVLLAAAVLILPMRKLGPSVVGGLAGLCVGWRLLSLLGDLAQVAVTPFWHLPWCGIGG